MTTLVPSDEIHNTVVIVVRVPHPQNSTCPAYLDPNIYESYWISLRELVMVL